MRRRRNPRRPDDCRALVTGGSGAIGAAICRRLAADGLHVLVHAAAHPERAEETAAAIRADGGQAEAVAFDLADGSATAAAMAGLNEAGALGVIVHNAGIHADGPMAGMSNDQWDKVIEVNLSGFFRVVQPALLGMARLGWGRVVAVSSVAGRIGNRGQTNYAAAKAGLHGAVMSLTREMAVRGITANTVAPGLIDTPMLSVDEAEASRALIPAGRLGRADEVASLVAFLCGDEAAYINAQMIGIDGGMVPG